jgi:integrase
MERRSLTGMATLPPGVTPYTDRHRRTRYRFRAKGLPARSIPGEPGDARFQIAYEAARAGKLRPQPARAGLGAKTLRAAWLQITTSIEWRQLKPSSRYQQTGVAERFLLAPIAEGSKTTFAQMPFEGIRRADIKRILARYADRPHAGEAVLRLLRKLCLAALDLEWIENDPTFRVTFRPKLIGHRAWTDEEMAQYEARWPVGTRERMGYAAALYTGQRRADVAAMGMGAYDGKGVAVTQEKTGAPLWIPAHPALVEAINATARTGPWIICTDAGRRYTSESFGNNMADAIADAGLPNECRLHGLRKSAGRCLAEAGCTAHQIMAILGHKSLAEAQKYTEAARQKMPAQQGMDQWSKPKFTLISGGK